MRQFIASAVIAAFVFTAASPTFAQRTRREIRPSTSPSTLKPVADTGSFADFGTIQAVTAGTGVIIKWTMNRETSVAGYLVYRIDGSTRTQVGQFVLGSAAKSRAPSMYGEQYSTYDPKGSAASVYTIEAIGMKGGSLNSEQIVPQFDRSASLAVAQADNAAVANAVNDSIETFSGTGPVPEATTPNLTNQQRIASQPGVKIGVNKEGLFRVTRAELQNAGFFNIAGSNNSANLRLFMEGNEQPIIVGASDQYIEFYGKGYDTPDTDTRVYYLLVDTVPGARMQTHTLNSTGGTSFATTTLVTAKKSEKSIYMSAVLNGPASNFYGTPVINTAPSSTTFVLPNLDTTNAGNATVTVTMHGFTDRSHTIQLLLNGHTLGTLSGFGLQQDMTGVYSVPVSFLLDGNNTLTFTASAASGGISDVDLFDNISVQFPQKSKAYQNVATIATPGRRKIALDGFSAPTTSTVTIKNATVAQPTTVQTPTSSATPGVLRLSAATYTAGTGGSSPVARITVSRVYGSTGAVGATLTLTNGTATGGSSCGGSVDFANTGPYTVSLADGVTAADVNVPICSGNITDPNGETFTATLSNPTGGATLPISNIRVFDISYDTPRIVNGLVPLQNGNNYGVLVPAYRNSTLYAIDDSCALQASSVTANTPSTLASASNAADMIILSYQSPDFLAAAENWANYRRSPTGGGFNVKVVSVEDVYDEFGYGAKGSQPINDFLKNAFNTWQTKPRYVLLIGDASYDPRNYQGGAAENMVPTQLVDLIFEQSGSDEALADFNGDGLAEIAIGRISVQDAATVNLVLSKTESQETSAQQAFSRGSAFINDMPIGYDFYSMSQTLRNELPPDMPATFVSRDSPPNSGSIDPNGNAKVLSALNSGPFIVNYSGHGAANLWGSDAFFNYQNLPQLTTPNESIYTMLTCFNGLFLQVGSDCLAERLLKQPIGAGGASLAWASTTETTPDIQLIMGQQFYHELGLGSPKRIGDLIADAKKKVPGGSDVRYSWALLGDPATQIRP